DLEPVDGPVVLEKSVRVIVDAGLALVAGAGGVEVAAGERGRAAELGTGLQEGHRSPRFAGGHRRHHARGPAADDDHVEVDVARHRGYYNDRSRRAPSSRDRGA